MPLLALKFHHPKFHLRRPSASAAVAVPFLALKEAVKPVEPVKALKVVPVEVEEGQEGSVSLKHAVRVEVELGAQA